MIKKNVNVHTKSEYIKKAYQHEKRYGKEVMRRRIRECEKFKGNKTTATAAATDPAYIYIYIIA